MWQIDRHHILKNNIPDIKLGDVVSVEHDWAPTFVFLPHLTISGRWVWLKKVYSRRVWVYTGFVDEPETQYGDFFDLLKSENVI
jgi:hypothetical protein